MADEKDWIGYGLIPGRVEHRPMYGDVELSGFDTFTVNAFISNENMPRGEARVEKATH